MLPIKHNVPKQNSTTAIPAPAGTSIGLLTR